MRMRSTLYYAYIIQKCVSAREELRCAMHPRECRADRAGTLLFLAVFVVVFDTISRAPKHANPARRARVVRFLRCVLHVVHLTLDEFYI